MDFDYITMTVFGCAYVAIIVAVLWWASNDD